MVKETKMRKEVRELFESDFEDVKEIMNEWNYNKKDWATIKKTMKNILLKKVV